MPAPLSGPAPAPEPLYGPVEVGAMLGVKPQVVINWIREGRARPSAEDALGRHRFTAADVLALRASLGTRRSRATMAGDAPRPEGAGPGRPAQGAEG